MYISVSDAATKFNISRRRVQFLCEQGRISGANMIDGVWLIPETATKPADRRKKHLDENQMSLFDTQKGSFAKLYQYQKQRQRTGFAQARLFPI